MYHTTYNNFIFTNRNQIISLTLIHLWFTNTYCLMISAFSVIRLENEIILSKIMKNSSLFTFYNRKLHDGHHEYRYRYKIIDISESYLFI
jgi:hypothetical protein